MLRNRLAAQASRDKRRAHVEFLESRLAELEEELSRADPPEASSSTSPSGNGTLAILESENLALRAQIEQERATTAILQNRLTSLESKFEIMSSLLLRPPALPSTPYSTLPSTPSPHPYHHHHPPTLPASFKPSPSLDLLPVPTSNTNAETVTSSDEELLLTAAGSPVNDFPTFVFGDAPNHGHGSFEASPPDPSPTSGLSADFVTLPEFVPADQLTASDLNSIWAEWESGLPPIRSETAIDPRFENEDDGTGFWACFEETENEETALAC